VPLDVQNVQLQKLCRQMLKHLSEGKRPAKADHLRDHSVKIFAVVIISTGEKPLPDKP
jgi:hypothetical protein